MLALGATPHDEVIVPAFGFPATANAVELAGARACLADVDADTYAITPASVEAVATDRTVGVIMVHPFGIPGPTNELKALCDARGWWLLEDAACALGTEQEGRWGSGDVPFCLSFHPRKTITTGEGGVVVTNDDALARSLRLLRNHGMAPDAPGWRRFSQVGFNYRMSDLAAAIGLVQLDRLDGIVAERQRVVGLYQEALSSIDGVVCPSGYGAGGLSMQSWVVTLDPRVSRDQVIGRLADEGIQTTLGGYALAEQPYYEERYGLRSEDYPVAARMAACSLTLPVTVDMDASAVERVVRCLRAAMEAG